MTEFSLANFTTPSNVTIQEQAAFMAEVLSRLEDYPFIERVSMFPGYITQSPDPNTDPYAASVLTDLAGNLNATGQAYSAGALAVNTVPEPSSALLFVFGSFFLLLYRRKPARC